MTILEVLNELISVSLNFIKIGIIKWLLGAIAMSFALHFMILYVPFFSMIFGTTPLTVAEWKVVFWFSFPVVLLDEFLKLVSRLFVAPKKK